MLPSKNSKEKSLIDSLEVKKNDVEREIGDGKKKVETIAKASLIPDSATPPSLSFPRNGVEKEFSFVPSSLRVVIISDTHGRHNQLTLPPGDILLHCGDCLGNFFLSERSKKRALLDFFEWINAQPFSIKFFIGGNHDGLFERYTPEEIREMASPALYLCHEAAIIEPIHWRVFGSPFSIRNSALSPFTAFQGRSMAWMRSEPCDTSLTWRKNSVHTVEESNMKKQISSAAVSPTLPPFSSASHGELLCDPSFHSFSAHVEPGFVVGAAPIDILMTHHGLMSKGKSSRNGEILEIISRISPLQLHCGGHLHGGHGLYWLHKGCSLKTESSNSIENGSSRDSTYQFHSQKQEEVDRWRKTAPPLSAFPLHVQADYLLSVNPACAPKSVFGSALRFPPTVLHISL